MVERSWIYIRYSNRHAFLWAFLTVHECRDSNTFQSIMDLVLAITYGARMDELSGEFPQGLLGSIHAVTIACSSTIAWRPFIRLLRIWPQSTSVVIEVEKVRRKHIDHMYNQYLQKVADGKKPTCIVSSLSADKLTLAELHGTCVYLLQAAPDTIASGIYQCVA